MASKRREAVSGELAALVLETNGSFCRAVLSAQHLDAAGPLG
jgi:hypothetical protein